MSLKNKIIYFLEKNGRLSLTELENLCKSEHKKLSNAERRLRELMAINSAIRPEKNSAGAIIAYQYQIPMDNAFFPKRIDETNPKNFCPSCGYFMNHSPSCATVKKEEVKKENVLF